MQLLLLLCLFGFVSISQGLNCFVDCSKSWIGCQSNGRSEQRYFDRNQLSGPFPLRNYRFRSEQITSKLVKVEGDENANGTFSCVIGYCTKCNKVKYQVWFLTLLTYVTYFNAYDSKTIFHRAILRQVSAQRTLWMLLMPKSETMVGQFAVIRMHAIST